MSDTRNVRVTLECRTCGAEVHPIYVGFIVESWVCPAGHEQHRTLGRRTVD